MDDYQNEAMPVGAAEVAAATQTLQRYKAGKAALDRRLVDNEQMCIRDSHQTVAQADDGADGDDQDEHHQHHIQDHEQGLPGQQHDQRQGQLCQLPQLQGDHGHTQEQRKADAANVIDLAHIHGVAAAILTHIADDGRRDHGTDIDGEGHARQAQKSGQHRADAHGDNQLEACRRVHGLSLIHI